MVANAAARSQVRRRDRMRPLAPATPSVAAEAALIASAESLL
jgi:hypothetical protein